jgi:uncharacterized protein DUF4331
MGMKRGVLLVTLGAAIAAAVVTAALVGAAAPRSASASSHREAPLIADDPAADNTDIYAFVSPDKPDTVTIIANYIPFEDPAGGPNYYRFDPSVRYELHVDNNGDARDDVTYRFNFKTSVANPNTFLYNTGPVSSATDATLNVKQTYSVTRITPSGTSTLVSGAPVLPANIGPRSNPTYSTAQGVADLGGNRKAFAGPRDDPFFVDLGSIFDLLGLRPFNSAHLIHDLANAPGEDGVKNYNTHTIAIQVPKTDVLPPPKGDGIIGVYASASRQKIRILGGDGSTTSEGPWVQVSRLGNPLINEVVIPVGKKDYWNASSPRDDQQFLNNYRSPELASLVNLLFPVLPPTATSMRDDLVAVLLTGVKLPDGTPFTFTGDRKADLLRLNTAVAPTASPDPLGVLAGDLQGFPNGRRLVDDVTDIEIRAVACGYGSFLNALLGLCNFEPNNIVGDGVDANENTFSTSFPYVAAPNRGYEHTGHE